MVGVGNAVLEAGLPLPPLGTGNEVLGASGAP